MSNAKLERLDYDMDHLFHAFQDSCKLFQEPTRKHHCSRKHGIILRKQARLLRAMLSEYIKTSVEYQKETLPK